MYVLSGDGVADTPSHKSSSLQSTCAHTTGCCLDAQGISTLNTCPGQPGMDPVRNFMNYLVAYCSQKYGEFTPGQITRMVAQYESFRSPTRAINCGCPQSCTAAILATPIAGGHTCLWDIQGGIADLGNEWQGCASTGSVYSQCAACNPQTCGSLNNANTPAPAPTTTTLSPVAVASKVAATTTSSPLTVLACARRVKSSSGCSSQRSVQLTAMLRLCHPPVVGRTAYRNRVFTKVTALCA
jgi:hypothetical protein